MGGAALIALAGARTVARGVLPDEADAYTNFCGHTYTTGNCPHPTGLPRVDRHDYPLRASDGHPVDDLGRPIERAGLSASTRTASGCSNRTASRWRRRRDRRSAPPPASEHGLKLSNDGSWYRCCGGRVRRMRDCCGYTSVRINGDAALTGYCYAGRKVFCVQYYETMVPC